MKTGTFPYEVEIELTPDEQIEKGHDLERALRDLDLIAEEKKEANGEYKQRSKEKSAEIAVLRTCVKHGKEPRMVDCYERINTTDKRIETVRGDNGDVVHSRPITPDENQLHIDTVFKGFAQGAREAEDAERAAKEEAAVVTTGATVISEMAQSKTLALAASNPAHSDADNDNAKPKGKKKSGAERAREKKAAAAAGNPKAAKVTKPAKPAKAPKTKAPKAPKADKPKRAKKAKSVLERHDFEDEEDVA